jgi:branched-subunit amino acid aminotransferase/4-amino-4-deoxychorismate lyase
MNEPVAYLNGRLRPADQAALSIVDAGFILGATVTEQLRSFGGRLFRTARHLERLRHSLDICGIDPGIESAEFARIADELVAHNHSLLAHGDDLGLAIFVTPGLYIPLAGACDLRSSGVGFSPRGIESEGNDQTAWAEAHTTADLRPQSAATVGLHTFPLAFPLWADAYLRGVSLVTTSIQQVPPQCWPPELKCRSRMHYFLADKEAAAKESGARALLLDAEGRVSETSTSNILIHEIGTGLISPPRSSVLPGVSLEVVIELAARLGIPFIEREIWPDDVAAADEVMLSSTPNCLLPVTRFDGHPIGGGNERPIFGQLLTAWGEMVGLDIAAQAARFAAR